MLSFHRRSLYTVITIIGLGYFVAYATIQFMDDWIGGSIPFFDYYHVPFIVLFLLSVFLVWTRPRIGYLLCIIVGLICVLFFTPLTFLSRFSMFVVLRFFRYVFCLLRVTINDDKDSG